MATINSTMLSDGLSDEPSSPESTTFDDSDLLRSAVTDDVTAQLAAAGTVGMAAAAAIATGKLRKKPYQFEINPSIRKRQQTRLLRKLKMTIEEYTIRVGQQAVVLCCTPGKQGNSGQSYKVFGSQPLENVLRNSKSIVMQQLEELLQQQAPQAHDVPGTQELPALVIDGIPTPVDKMTQAQLRAFIPEMLKYSTGRSKPGWGKPEYRPVWWPCDVPWANVRSDVRPDDIKKRVSWTVALRAIVRNCYKHHGREDLLPDFSGDETVPQMTARLSHTMLQAITNPDGTISIIQIDTGDTDASQVLTLADGTQAQVVQFHDAQEAVRTLTVPPSQGQTIASQTNGLELSADVTGLMHDGQFILASAGSLGMHHMPVGVVTIPVSMYQSVISGMSQLTDSPGRLQVVMPNSMVDEVHETSSDGLADDDEKPLKASLDDNDTLADH